MFQPVPDPVAGSLALSALVAALPLLTLFALLGGLRWKAWQAGLASLLVALLVAVLAFGMPASQSLLAASEGAGFGLFPIIWIVLTAIWVFRLTELTGYDLLLRRAFGSVSPDHRVQAILIAFCFGALLEALAGFGTPVAVTAVMLIAVGLRPLKAAAVALVANTAPVAFGAIAVPITTLAKITGLDAADLASMAGRQTPVLAAIVPLVLVVMVDGRRGLRQAWLPALVGGLGFALTQYVTSNFLAYEITDILAAFVGALALVLLLRVWQPAQVLQDQAPEEGEPAAAGASAASAGGGGTTLTATEAESVTTAVSGRQALLAFAPYLVVVLLFTAVSFGPLKTFLADHSGWKLDWPGLQVAGSDGTPLAAATFNLNVFSAAGTTLLVAGVVTALVYRVRAAAAARALLDVVVQFRFTILTVVSVLALAYVMNFSGQTVTLGLALASTGGFFAFLSAVVGWIGVAVTGSDTSSNSLFGLLQVTAAEETHLSPYLLAAANTSGGVLGKMISPQNLAIAAAVVGMEGRESLLFRRVLGWSLLLLLLMCLLVLLQSTPVLGWMVVG
ncbi:L-lactate permease [Phycicoccus endophyticus]|uniref:L-lactate permease n=1 Tax=Phycicoccus endophyticus TaxID=1690220 RepID=A0A7G9R2X1_9MICO|nr:L-lactate permease [Phycicoccus endophyticus]NHI20234.1 L-lactate permease [Phycicoccus endophyticus]QNN49946.1 L-lactate permease [Phycicoccus endophyticus]GGL29376.1 L-lactate permease [Phycicoccus endophyticus]